MPSSASLPLKPYQNPKLYHPHPFTKPPHPKIPPSLTKISIAIKKMQAGDTQIKTTMRKKRKNSPNLKVMKAKIVNLHSI
jgi:hypothetical protein